MRQKHFKYASRLALLENYLLGINYDQYFDKDEQVYLDDLEKSYEPLKLNIENKQSQDPELHLLLDNPLFLEGALKGLDYYINLQYFKLSAEEYREVLLMKGKYLNNIIGNEKVFIHFLLTYFINKYKEYKDSSNEDKHEKMVGLYYSYALLIDIYNELS